jgi:hypothetical protein
MERRTTTTTCIDSAWQFEPRNTWKMQTREKRIRWHDVEVIIGFPFGRITIWSLDQETYVRKDPFAMHHRSKISIHCT